MEKFNYDLLNNREYVVLDIETTGFSREKGGRIIEIAAIKIVDDKIVDEYSTLVNPSLKIPKKITTITGITNEMVADKPNLSKVIGEFYEFLGDSVLVIHNAKFDWQGYLLKDFFDNGFIVKNEVIDTLKLSKLTFTDKNKHKLSDLCEYLSVDLVNSHRALNDTKALALAFIKLKEMNKKGSQLSFVAEPSTPKKENTKKVKKPNINIKTANYWQTKHGSYKRIYINLYYDFLFTSVYYDMILKAWKVKEYKGDENIDFAFIQEATISFLNACNKELLKEFMLCLK